MADNITLNVGSGGDIISADDVAGVKVQRVKVQFGEDGTSKDVTSSWPLPVAQAARGTQSVVFHRYLDTNGDGTGTKNANGDYSAAATSFYIQPPASTIYRIAQIKVYVEDTSGFNTTEYGNLGAALTNGITVRVHDGTSTITDLTDGEAVTANHNWALVCDKVEVLTWGATNEILIGVIDIAANGQYIRLDGDATERLEVVLNDDLTGLVEHYFVAHGYTENTET